MSHIKTLVFNNVDGFLKVVTPLKNGVHGFHKCLRTLDPGFFRNDRKKAFSTFYETIKGKAGVSGCG